MNNPMQSDPDRNQRLRRLAQENLKNVALGFWGQPNTQLSTQSSLRWGNNGSKSLELAGSRAGLWYDHEIGNGGDIITLIQNEHQCTYLEALTWIEDRFATPATQNLSKDGNRSRAIAIWQEARCASGTLVEHYLRNRRCWHPWLSDGKAIRFHPNCPDSGSRFPAMIALMTNLLTGEPTGVHRTYLMPDGSKRSEAAKKTLGGKMGSLIRLKDDDGSVAILAEGIENALTAAHFTSDKVISAIDCGNLSKIDSIPGVSHVAIFSDPKEQEQLAAFTHAARCRLAGISCQVLRPKSALQDLNDLAVAA